MDVEGHGAGLGGKGRGGGAVAGRIRRVGQVGPVRTDSGDEGAVGKAAADGDHEGPLRPFGGERRREDAVRTGGRFHPGDGGARQGGRPGTVAQPRRPGHVPVRHRGGGWRRILPRGGPLRDRGRRRGAVRTFREGVRNRCVGLRRRRRIGIPGGRRELPLPARQGLPQGGQRGRGGIPELEVGDAPPQGPGLGPHRRQGRIGHGDGHIPHHRFRRASVAAAQDGDRRVEVRLAFQESGDRVRPFGAEAQHLGLHRHGLEGVHPVPCIAQRLHRAVAERGAYVRRRRDPEGPALGRGGGGHRPEGGGQGQCGGAAGGRPPEGGWGLASSGRRGYDGLRTVRETRMAEVAFDTIAEVRRLRDVGFAQDQAEAITRSIHAGVTGGVATKADLERLGGQVRAVEAGLRTDMERLGGELRTEIAKVEGNLRTEIESVRTEIESVRTEVAGLRTDFAAGQAAHLRWMVGLTFALVVALVGVLGAALFL